MAALGAAGAALVVIGASGGYEAGVLAALWASGQALVPAQRVRHLARADGQLAKTARIDARIDARILALFAARMRPVPTPPIEESRRVLRGLVARRRVLVATRADEMKRLRQRALPRVPASATAHVGWLAAEIASLEAEIRAAITACRNSDARAVLLRTMPGIGATAAVFESMTRFAAIDQRLRNAGKPHKPALVAVMRKMRVTLNAMVRQNQTFTA